MTTEHEQARRNLWAQALLDGSKHWCPLEKSYSQPFHIQYADKVLEAYDAKFPEPVKHDKTDCTNNFGRRSQ